EAELGGIVVPGGGGRVELAAPLLGRRVVVVVVVVAHSDQRRPPPRPSSDESSGQASGESSGSVVGQLGEAAGEGIRGLGEEADHHVPFGRVEPGGRVEARRVLASDGVQGGASGRGGHGDLQRAPVRRVSVPCDVPVVLQPVQQLGGRGGGDAEVAGQVAGGHRHRTVLGGEQV